MVGRPETRLGGRQFRLVECVHKPFGTWGCALPGICSEITSEAILDATSTAVFCSTDVIPAYI